MSANDEAKLAYSLQMFSDALKRLQEALAIPVTDANSVVMDGSIQRFEFCYEMSWRTLKRFLEHQGVIAKTPRDAFRAGFKLGLLGSDDSIWMKMIEDRNLTAQTYNREKAKAVYRKLPSFAAAYAELESELRRLMSQTD